MEAPPFEGEMIAVDPPSLLELRWGQVHPAYVRRLGPDASTIGPPAEWEAAHGQATDLSS